MLKGKCGRPVGTIHVSGSGVSSGRPTGTSKDAGSSVNSGHAGYVKSSCVSILPM